MRSPRGWIGAIRKKKCVCHRPGDDVDDLGGLCIGFDVGESREEGVVGEQLICFSSHDLLLRCIIIHMEKIHNNYVLLLLLR